MAMSIFFPDLKKDFKNAKIIEKKQKYIAFKAYNNLVYSGILHGIGRTNDNQEFFGIELNLEVEYGSDGIFNDIALFQCAQFHGVLVDSKIQYIELCKDTEVVLHHKVDDIIEEKELFLLNQSVLVKRDDGKEKIEGKIIRQGHINGIPCCAVKLDECQKLKDDYIIVLTNSVSENSEKYRYVRYTLDSGVCGIQGNLNSCYLDTSLFSIFTFNNFLDNMLMDHCSNEKVHELQSILRTEIVYQLRRDAKGYVGYKTVTKFRDKLQALSPSGKFVINERDPEEFLEQLFKLLTPDKYLLKTSPLHDMNNVQNCFLTQLFYQSTTEKKHINLEEMLTLSFLEFEMLITMPPKCLILQLPRDGRQMKKFKCVTIPAKLDITPFVLSAEKKCKECSTTCLAVFYCKTCSLSRLSLTYYCKDHTTHCTHDKIAMPDDRKPFHGNIKLDLVSILCIEKTHYVAFVKTNNVVPKWLYYNSMEKIENGIFSPLVRETKLDKYFANGASSLEYDRDVEKIENYAFICFYKNPALEFYQSDFNTVNRN